MPTSEKKSDKSEIVVLAPLVVLKTTAGTGVYLYRGAQVGDGYDQKSVDHHKELGLIGDADDSLVPGRSIN